MPAVLLLLFFLLCFSILLRVANRYDAKIAAKRRQAAAARRAAHKTGEVVTEVIEGVAKGFKRILDL